MGAGKGAPLKPGHDLRHWSKGALIEKLLEQDEVIRKADHVCNWLMSVLDSRDHRALSAVRRLLRMKPEIPPGMLEAAKNRTKSSVGHSK